MDGIKKLNIIGQILKQILLLKNICGKIIYHKII